MWITVRFRSTATQMLMIELSMKTTTRVQHMSRIMKLVNLRVTH
jgi:hypothetical protein